MQYFITTLVDYFACDGTTANRMLSREEAEACTRKYDAARLSFLSEEERRKLSTGPEAKAAALRTGYRRFRDWLSENPERAGHLRRMASARGRGQAT